MYKIVNYEELIKIRRYSEEDDLDILSNSEVVAPWCFLCRKNFKLKSAFFGLTNDDYEDFIFRCCSEECINIYIIVNKKMF